jgi:murein DD-endopeptidase MepM/ murein hydrolase activator NlpD
LVVQASNIYDGYGNCVLIKYKNGIVTRYAHCYSIDIKLGDIVKRCQAIATVGSTGNSTGNHLHFEIIINNVLHDPMDYVNVFPDVK